MEAAGAVRLSATHAGRYWLTQLSDDAYTAKDGTRAIYPCPASPARADYLSGGTDDRGAFTFSAVSCGAHPGAPAMCYSAQIKADYAKYLRHFGASISLQRFTEMFWARRHWRTVG